ncbi:MAG: hypothetical protein FJY74_00730 [Candidatus Eisenbacteria bacterium]|nr:hypothetical protein [Candidatus Eisenbacteria bacterium]
MLQRRGVLVCGALAVVALVATGCAPGSDRFTTGDAGFWAGLWHGLIVCVTFIVSLFTERVQIYEIRNSGHLYDLGFVLGAIAGLGGILKPRGWARARRRKLAEREMEEISRRVEAHVRRAIKGWAEGAAQDDEWADIGRKVEQKIKVELRKWAES